MTKPLRVLCIAALCASSVSGVGMAQNSGQPWVGSETASIQKAPGWSVGFEAPGADGDVLAMIEFRGELVVAGRFEAAGALPARHIVQWDGANWHALGHGIDGDVHALAIFNGALVAAGRFERAGSRLASNIAAWSGKTWEPLSLGVDGVVHAMLVHEGRLIIGGRFESAGGVQAHSIAAWDGTTWRALGNGVQSPADGDAVRALAIHAGGVVAGGSFDVMGGQPARSVARWDGQAWSAIGQGFDLAVDALVDFDGQLVAGGSFELKGGSGGRAVAVWNGSAWTELDGPLPGSSPVRRAMLVHDGGLIAAGSFTNPGREPGNGVMRWNGTTWSRLGGALEGGVSAFALCEFGGDLHVGGSFNDAAGAVVNRVARLQKDRWLPLTTGAGTDDAVRALTTFRGDVIAGGSFSRAGSRRADGVARWDGGRWHAMGDGVDGVILALLVHRDAVVAAGEFTLPGALDVPVNVARWNGSTWQALGAGLDGRVLDMAVYRDDLYAIGRFAGLKPDGDVHLARWDGVAWEDAGVTLDAAFGRPTANALVVYDDELIVGGRFDRVNQMAIRNVVATDGTGWFAFDSGVDEVVDDLAVFDDRLYVGGFFNFAGDLFAPQIAAWDGFQWNAVGSGLFFSQVIVLDAVLRLHATPKGLVLGGRFDGVDAVRSTNLALWDGTRWTSIGSGANASTLAFASVGDALFVGGHFDRVDGLVSSRVAKWEWALPSPVVDELAAEIVEESVELHWQFSESVRTSVQEVHVWRAEGGLASPARIASLVPHGGAMRFVDRDIEAHATYAYRLELERVVGASIASSELVVVTRQLYKSQVGTVSDRPGAPVQVRYTVGTARTAVSLRIFDIRGRLVRRIDEPLRGRGSFVASWNRRTERGERAARGVYLVRVELGSRTATRKFVLLHD